MTTDSMSATSLRLAPFEVAHSMADSARAPKKRSILNKPKWAAKTTIAEANTKYGDGEFYRHGNAVYGDVLAEEERKRAKRRAKAVEKGRIRNADKRDSKRRRVSEDEDCNSDPDSSHSQGHAVRESSSTRREGPVTRSTPTKKRDVPRSETSLGASSCDLKRTPPIKATVVDLGDNDDDAVDEMPNTPAKTMKVSPLRSRPKPPSSDAESDNEDEYLVELKRRARERARMQKLGITKPQTDTTDPTAHKSQSPATGTDLPLPSSAKSPRETSFHQTPPAPSATEKVKDTRVSILIQTAIPDTKQLIVNRLASQNFQQVREAWCRRQEFDDPEAMMRKVFLTWRGTRLYDATTCTRILSTMKAERQNSRWSFDSDDEDSDHSQGKIEVEAITEEIMAERKKAKEQEEAAAAGERGDTEEDSPSEEPAPPKEADLKIWLKNPDMEPLQLKVRPHTEVSRIMAGFKKIRNVEGGKTCWLIFEGERLDAGTTIDNTEIRDGDLVDVQIR